MLIQKFAPMSKNFPTFDCDAHVTEPPWLWERAKDYLTKDEFEALKSSIWFDQDSKQLIVNGFADIGLGSQRIGGSAGQVNVLSLAGPGLKHDIQRALNVRNLNRATALTKEQAAYIDHAGSYEPKPRLRDMDVQGISTDGCDGELPDSAEVLAPVACDGRDGRRIRDASVPRVGGAQAGRI
jgi:hypothetical protein